MLANSHCSVIQCTPGGMLLLAVAEAPAPVLPGGAATMAWVMLGQAASCVTLPWSAAGMLRCHI